MFDIDKYYWRLAEARWTIPLFGAALLFLAPWDFVFGRLTGLHRFIKERASAAAAKGNKPDCIIVPGYGLVNGRVSPLLQERLDQAVELVRRGEIRTVLLSGDSAGTDYSEPRAMSAYLTEACQLEKCILQMDESGYSTFNTFKNAGSRYGIRSCYIATNDFHMVRCLWTAWLTGIDAYPCTEIKRVSPYRWGWLLREKAAIYWYTFEYKRCRKGRD